MWIRLEQKAKALGLVGKRITRFPSDVMKRKPAVVISHARCRWVASKDEVKHGEIDWIDVRSEMQRRSTIVVSNGHERRIERV